MRKLMQLIYAQFQSAGFNRSNARNTATTYLRDMRLATKYAVLLINFSDSDAANPAFSNPRAKSHREVRKKAGEGNDYSAHVVIHFEPIPAKPDTYLLLLEQSPGLSSTRVLNFLRYLVRMCVAADETPFMVPHPDGGFDKDGNARQIRLRHSLHLNGHPSDQFVKELNEGVLLGVELITERYQGNNWDEDHYSTEQQRTISLKPKASSGAAKWFSMVKSMAAQATNKNYELARVRFKTKFGISRRVDLDTSTVGLVQDDMYVRKERIDGFGAKLGTSFSKIHPEIETKMLSLKAK